MDITKFDRDDILNTFLIDFIDGNLDEAEKQAFKDYLFKNEKECEFAVKAIKAKKLLSKFSDRLDLNRFTCQEP